VYKTSKPSKKAVIDNLGVELGIGNWEMVVIS